MLLAEDVLLLLTDDESGKGEVDRQTIGFALAGAVFIELAALGLLDVTEKEGWGRGGRVELRSGPAPTDPVLLDALARLEALQGRTPESALTKLSKHLHAGVVHSLVSRGILSETEHKVLGLFPTERWPAADSRHESDVRRLLVSILNGERTPDQRSAALISLLHAVNRIGKLEGLADKHEAKRRAKEIAEAEWGAKAVSKAIQSVQAAVMSTIIVTSTMTATN